MVCTGRKILQRSVDPQWFGGVGPGMIPEVTIEAELHLPHSNQSQWEGFQHFQKVQGPPSPFFYSSLLSHTYGHFPWSWAGELRKSEDFAYR